MKDHYLREDERTALSDFTIKTGIHPQMTNAMGRFYQIRQTLKSWTAF